MLRLNVAPDQFRKNAWVVYLFAGDGNEHIYQRFAGSAVHAARLALSDYETQGSAPDYPETQRYVLSAEE